MNDRFYGYTEEQWDAMRAQGLAYLEELARDRRDTDYSTFCAEVRRRAGVAPEPHDHALPHLLGAIGTRSYEDRQVIITALIHDKGGNEPGPGFYELAEQLRALNREQNPWIARELREVFWVRHVGECHEAYARKRP